MLMTVGLVPHLQILEVVVLAETGEAADKLIILELVGVYEVRVHDEDASKHSRSDDHLAVLSDLHDALLARSGAAPLCDYLAVAKQGADELGYVGCKETNIQALCGLDVDEASSIVPLSAVVRNSERNRLNALDALEHGSN